MKSIILVLVINLTNLVVFAQGVAINQTGNAPKPNSILDIDSDDKGVFFPRLTTIARTTLGTSLVNTDNGMFVYDKDLLVFFYWDGTQWVQVGAGTGSDDQNLTGATLTGTSLQIDIEDGNSTTVDLSGLQDGVDDADNNPNNELQTISKTGSTVTLSNGGGSFTDDDTQLTETQVDAFTNNNGYLTSFTEVDGSTTNELQDLSLNTTTNILTITNNGSATSIDLTPYIDNTDNQTLSLNSNTLSISNGNSVTLTDNVNDADNDPNNEIELPTGGTNGQVLSTDGSGGYSWVNDASGTDNQNISGSGLSGTVLTIGIENGTNETVDFATITVPPGAVMAFNLATCPTGWVKANGTGGTPDLRGEFIRGLDDGRGIDAGRILNSNQFQETELPYQILGNFDGFPGTPGLNNNAPVSIVMTDDYLNLNNSGHGTSRNVNWTNNETRPRNVALLYCIKQ